MSVNYYIFCEDCLCAESLWSLGLGFNGPLYSIKRMNHFIIEHGNHRLLVLDENQPQLEDIESMDQEGTQP